MDCKTCGTYYEPKLDTFTPVQCGVCKSKNDNGLVYVEKGHLGCLMDDCSMFDVCIEDTPCEIKRMVFRDKIYAIKK